MMNLSAPWVLVVERDVAKTLKKFPRDYAAAIFDAINLLPTDPFAGDIEKMKGEDNVWRRRIGAYRFKYELRPASRMVIVFHVERRTSTTYH